MRDLRVTQLKSKELEASNPQPKLQLADHKKTKGRSADGDVYGEKRLLSRGGLDTGSCMPKMAAGTGDPRVWKSQSGILPVA